MKLNRMTMNYVRFIGFYNLIMPNGKKKLKFESYRKSGPQNGLFSLKRTRIGKTCNRESKEWKLGWSNWLGKPLVYLIGVVNPVFNRRCSTVPDLQCHSFLIQWTNFLNKQIGPISTLVKQISALSSQEMIINCNYLKKLILF